MQLPDESRGYAIVEAGNSKPKLKAIINSLEHASEGGARAGLRHLMRIPAVRDLAGSSELRNIAAHFIGVPAIPYKATLFDKSATANWLVAWHQDITLPVRERVEATGWSNWSTKDGVLFAQAPAEVLEKIVALRIHLDDSTPENGPLRVLPGSHLHGRLSSDQIAQLAQEISTVECLAGAGGVVAMRPLLIHSSSKSKSDAPRRVLHIEYTPTLQVAPAIELAIA